MHLKSLMAARALRVTVITSFYIRLVLLAVGIATIVLSVLDFIDFLQFIAAIVQTVFTGVINVMLSLWPKGVVLVIIVTLDSLSICLLLASIIVTGAAGYWLYGASMAFIVLQCFATCLVVAVIVCDGIELHAHTDQGAGFARSPRKYWLGKTP